MKLLKKLLIIAACLLLVLYIGLCTYLYTSQEKFLFYAQKLPIDHQFNFGEDAFEMFINAEDNAKLNGILFTSDSSKGLVFYLHGNAGTLETWGDVAHNFTNNGYDVFILDYRGFGKSEGTIESEEQFFSDAQAAYNALKNNYDENEITILGYSIGTGVATHLAANNHPARLILQAPFYDMTEMAMGQYPFVPTFLLRYKFDTDEYIQKVEAPVVLLHGDRDELIPYDCSIRLKEKAKGECTLIPLHDLGHSGWNNTPEYTNALKKIL